MSCRTGKRSAVAEAFFTAAFIIAFTIIPVRADVATSIGIFADEAHSECSLYPVPLSPVTFWVWVQPGENGLNCAEFEIATPPNVINAAAYVNPAAGYQFGIAIAPPGVTVCFPDCLTDWVWTHQITCLVTDTEPSVVTLEPHGDYGIMRAATCVDFNTYEEMTKINDMFINQGCCLGLEESSWGAVKSILR